MWKIIGVAVLVWVTLWTIRVLVRKPGVQQKNAPLKNPKTDLKTEQILVTCHYNQSHSTPQAATNDSTESTEENEPTLAAEFDDEPAEQISVEPEDELDNDELPVSNQSEYGASVALMRMIGAFGTLTKETASDQERKQAAEVLEKLQGTKAMDQLKKEPRRAAKIDELINERFIAWSKTKTNL